MFYTLKKAAVAMVILIVATAPLAGCNDSGHHQAATPVIAQAPPAPTESFLWLWLAVSPGVVLVVLLLGIHIGAKGIQDALKRGGQ